MGSMLAKPLRALRSEPRGLAMLAVGVLLAAIVVAGLVGLVFNQRVERFADDELQYDVELENRANELRAAIIELEHDHRDLLINGASDRYVADFEDSYALLHERIDLLA
ncbi:hypothetical protein E0L93_06845 [Rubrobacter taiwanensis]|uniref:Uncharacterized protein n=1 Tax=Rubrobacter taiwanensis TaxID=185139 RepID=A0A4R1BLD1_9ACTN|nr:hypothetical protein [Rubrobacter taiwanensis]TCJ18127.1 hypothetical protein E0L93_06845 [Rubrobacter taiwanensis]